MQPDAPDFDEVKNTELSGRVRDLSPSNLDAIMVVVSVPKISTKTRTRGRTCCPWNNIVDILVSSELLYQMRCEGQELGNIWSLN